MTTFAYQGFDRAGAAVAGTTDARDAADAADVLHRQGVFATAVRESAEAATTTAAAPARGGSAFGQGRRLKLVALLLRQLHVLLATGSPLAESLAAMERQATDARWRAVIGDLRARVQQGVALSAAIAAYPDYFSPVCRGLIAAGETGGKLDEMLERLAGLTRRQLHVRNSIVGAMVYPILLTVVAVGVLITLMTFVLPRFNLLFQSLDTPLPPATKVLMGLSALTLAYWWAIPFLIGGAVGGTWWGLRTPTGRRGLDKASISLPRFGPICRNFQTARLARLLGILVQGHVPLLEALDMTRDATGNGYYRQLLAGAADAVTRGDTLAGAFAAHAGLVSDAVCESVRSGEKSGQLGTLLATVADYLDEENEVTLRSLTSIIEPVILVVLGVMVGFIAISMFMPLFDLTSATGAK